MSRGQSGGTRVSDKIRLHIVKGVLEVVNLSTDGISDLPLFLELLLQSQDLIPLSLFLQISEPVPKGMERVSFLSLAEEVCGCTVARVKDLLADILSIILDLNKRILVNLIYFRFLAFIIFI